MLAGPTSAAALLNLEDPDRLMDGFGTSRSQRSRWHRFGIHLIRAVNGGFIYEFRYMNSYPGHNSV